MFYLPTELLLYLLLITLVTCLAAHTLAHFAPQLDLLAEPGEHRLHQQATPMVGGLAIYIALLVGAVFVDNSYISLMPALFILCAVGAFDDKYNLPSWVRFMAQGVAAYIMVKMTGVQLNSLGYLSPGREWLLGHWSVPMTIFAAIGVINAVNMSDGLDGLAGSLVLTVLVGLLLSGSANHGLILIAISAVIGFLILNLRLFRPRAKIFMGDAGSTMLGLLLTYLLISHSQVENGIWPVTALWLLALPLIDAVAVLLVRPIRGRSPFSADRIHYHHQLIDRGCGVNTTLVIAVVLQSGFIALGVAAWRLRVADHLQLLVYLVLFMLYVGSLLWFTRKPRIRPIE